MMYFLKELRHLENKGQKEQSQFFSSLHKGKAGYTMQEEQETKLQGKRYLVFGKLGPRTCSLLFLVHTRRTGSDLCPFSGPLNYIWLSVQLLYLASPHLLHYTYFPLMNVHPIHTYDHHKLHYRIYRMTHTLTPCCSQDFWFPLTFL